MSECSGCPEDLKEICIDHYGNDGSPACAKKGELAQQPNNTARQQALREIASDIDCWIRRVNQVGDVVSVGLLKAWHRQLQPLL